MNGVIEVANKKLKKIIQKMVVIYKDWNEMLPYALNVYHTPQSELHGCNSLLFGIQDGNNNAFRSGNFIFKGFNGCWTKRVKVGKVEIWVIESD